MLALTGNIYVILGRQFAKYYTKTAGAFLKPVVSEKR
jgi:hypothetical protein